MDFGTGVELLVGAAAAGTLEIGFQNQLRRRGERGELPIPRAYVLTLRTLGTSALGRGPKLPLPGNCNVLTALRLSNYSTTREPMNTGHQSFLRQKETPSELHRGCIDPPSSLSTPAPARIHGRSDATAGIFSSATPPRPLPPFVPRASRSWRWARADDLRLADVT